MGKITRLQLENFTCFAKLDLEFSSGVNVLIGVNGTGKTHILKVLYSVCAITVGEGMDKDCMNKICGVFSPYEGRYERLCRHSQHSRIETRIIIFKDNGDKLDINFSSKVNPRKLTSIAPYELGRNRWGRDALESVYIPVKEMLAHAPGFISLTAKREIAFEELYVDIIKQAYLPKLKTLPSPTYEEIHKDLGKAIGGEVILKGEYFFLKTKRGEIEFSLLAEGLRKVALLWLLIQNGSLNPGTILFWDEPEANMNPALVGLIVETILELQRQGVQVFLTTHNYVLLKEFDLRKKLDDMVRYVSLYRDESDAVSAHTSDDYLTIHPNAIAETFDHLYDEEMRRSLAGA